MATKAEWLTAGGILAAAAYFGLRGPGRQLGPALSVPQPARFRGVPFAGGNPAGWPLQVEPGQEVVVSYRDAAGEDHGNAARRFGAPREGVRYHVGIDLYADAGDVVRAAESGVVVRTQTFKLGTWALLVRGDSGITVNYGEVKPSSWLEFGVAEGKRVAAGQPIARVGLSSSGSHMLHLETYSCCPVENESWPMNQPAPPHVLDPTSYLLCAAARSGARVKL